MSYLRRLLLMDGHVCPWWLAYTFDNPLRRMLHPPEKVLGEFIRPGQTVLDIGCGMGYFTLAMARMVGAAGHVMAVDIQGQMLARVNRRALRQKLEGRIRLYRGEVDGLGVSGNVDFALAFWMVHEVPDQAVFFKAVIDVLKPEGRFLMVEPLVHTTSDDFQRSLQIAREAGLKVCGEPAIRISRAALLMSEAPKT